MEIFERSARQARDGLVGVIHVDETVLGGASQLVKRLLTTITITNGLMNFKWVSLGGVNFTFLLTEICRWGMGWKQYLEDHPTYPNGWMEAGVTATMRCFHGKLYSYTLGRFGGPSQHS